MCQECGGGLASEPLGIMGTVRTEHCWGVGCLCTYTPRSGPSVCPVGRYLCPSPCSRCVILTRVGTLFAGTAIRWDRWRLALVKGGARGQEVCAHVPVLPIVGS